MKVNSLEILRCDAGWRNYHFLKLTTDEGIVGWSEFDEGFGSPGGRRRHGAVSWGGRNGVGWHDGEIAAEAPAAVKRATAKESPEVPATTILPSC